MVEVYLIITGLVIFAWLYALVRQALRGARPDETAPPRPIVPLNLMDSDEAVLVAEGRGRIVFANEPARDWFGLDGGAPNLTVMAQKVQPSDTLHDLLAGTGHASFRLGQRQVEAVSHAIPGTEGQRMVVVMRELTATSLQTYTEFDPLRALGILDDIGHALGARLDLDAMVDTITASIEQVVEFETAEVTLWNAETRTLRPVGRGVMRTPTGNLITPDESPEIVYELGEGYSGWLAMYRQPLLINNVSARTDVLPKLSRDDFQSYIGVPLLIGTELLGTLELTHEERNAFSQRDMALLQGVSGQVAAAVQAARLFQEQSARVAELGGLQQIAQAMSQLNDPVELYSQLTQRIASLMGVELCGVLLYHDDEQMFRSQPPFYGVPDALIRHYRLSLVPDTELYSIWHHQPWWFSNEPDADLIDAMGFNEVSTTIEFRALALVPMVVGTRRLGLLLVANKHNQRGFANEDMHTLMSYASQAAVVTENSRLYIEEQRRTRELGGLQQIAQAIGVLRNPAELYSQITARIAELMGVQMCGILLYDLKERVLVSQQPFFGMDDQEAVDFYQIPMPPDGPVARLWQERDAWFCNDVRRDPPVAGTDLAALATEVGMRQIVAAALVVGGNRLGIIQVSNTLDGSDFTEDDARLLSIFGGQAAILIDNARLYREMQRRTHEAEGLRAVTEIASQSTPDAETVEAVMIAIANLVESNVVAIALVEEGTGELVIEPSMVWGVSLDEAHRIDAYAPGFEQSVLVSRQPFLSNDLRDDERVLPDYKRLIKQLGLRSGIQVPLVIQERSIGELTIGNRVQDEPYTDSDIGFMQAVATQVAAMVDRMRLYQSTDQDLRARVQELNALGRVSHELSQTLELARILDVIRQEALRSTDANAVSIVLLADRRDWPEPDQPQIEQRYGEGRALRGLAPVERAAVLRNDVLMVEDYAASDFEPRPSKARSALVVPVMFGDQVIGLIHLYGQEPGGFSQGVVDFIVALTDQATIAIGNSRRYQEQLASNERLRVRAERMGRIFELGEMFRQGASLAEVLEEVAHSIQETVGFNVVLVSLADDDAGVMKRTAQAGLPLAVFEEMQAISPPLAQARGLMQDIFKISNSYFLPAEGAEELRAGLPVYAVLQEPMGTGPRAWDPEDLMIVPLNGSGGHLLGLISVDEPRSGRRPDQGTVEALEIFASQAAFSIENYRLIERIRQEAEATRRERDRLAQLHLVTSEIQSATDVPARLQVVADGIHEAGWGHVIITLRDERLEPTALIQSGYDTDTAMALSDEVVPGKVWRAWINDLAFHELKLGAGYYLRYDDPWVREHVLKDVEIDPPSIGSDQWHPQDVLYLPLVGQDQKRIIGIISMDEPSDGRVPTEASLQPFELFASQAAAAIETTRLYQETVRAAEQEQRLNEVMEAVSTSMSPEAVLEAVGHGLQQMVPFTRMSVARYNEATDQFDMLRADLALDSTVTVSPGDSLPFDKTALGLAFTEQRARVYNLGRDAARENFVDLNAWYESGERSTLIVPMIAGGQTVGALRLGSELENAFSYQENLELIQRLANLSAVALDNARLFEQAQDRATALDDQAKRLEALNRMSARLAQTLDSAEIYRIVLEEMQAALELDYGGLMMLEPENGISRLVLSTHPMDDPMPDLQVPLKGNPVAEYMLETRQPYISEDLLNDPRFESMWDIQRARNTAAMMIVPVVMGEQVIGTIGLDSSRPRVFTEAEVEMAMTAANQAAVAIENARLFSEAQRRAVELNEQAQRMVLVNKISTRLAQTLDPQEIYSIVLEELQDVLSVSFAGLVMFEDEDFGRLVLDTHPSFSPDMPVVPLNNNPSIDYIRETQRPFVSADVMNEPKLEPVHDLLRQRGTMAMMIVPLFAGDQLVGTLGLDSTTPRTFTEAEIELVRTVASQTSLALEKARLYNETLGLTIFNQAVVESIQQGIVVLDLDLNIRRVNRFMVERYGWSTAAVDQALFEYRPDYEEFLRESLAIVLTMGDPQVQYEVERRDEAGLPSIRNYYIYPMREGRRVSGLVLLLEDVTERARLEADLEARAVQMAALSEVSSQITATLEPDQVIDLILDALGRVVPYDGVSLWLRAEERDELFIAAARGYKDPDATGVDELVGLTVEIPFSPLFREMADNARVINVGDVSAGDPRFPYGSAAIYKNWLGAPLISKGKVVGVIALEKRDTDFYDALHEQLTLTFANQAAVALDNAQLFEETRARAQALNDQAQRLALLNRVSLALAQTLDLENIFEIALREAAIALNVSEGSAIQIDIEHTLARVIVEYPRGDAPPEETYDVAENEAIERVCTNLIPLVVENIEEDSLRDDLRQMMRRDDVQSTLIVPLVVGGEVIGILRLDSVTARRQFTNEQIELAQTIASQAGIAVQNAALFEQAAIRTSELETLFESAQATAVTLDLDEVVRRVTVQVLSALATDTCTVFLWDDVSNQLVVGGDISSRPEGVRSDQPGDVYQLTHYPLREKALRECELTVVQVGDADLPPGERTLMEQHNAATRLLIPLIVNEISIGLVEVEVMDNERTFKPETLRMAQALASQAAISIENARLQTETRRTVEELYIINEMSGGLSSANNLEQLLAVIDEQLPSLTDAQILYVALYDADTETLNFPLAVSVLDDEPLEMPARPMGKDEFSMIIRQRAPLLLAGENLDDVRRSLQIESAVPGSSCFLGVPLYAGEELIGVLAVRDDDDPLAFSHNDQRILNTVGAQLGVAIQSTRLFQQTLELAEVLDQRVQERTAELEQERQHIGTLYAITTELATSLDMERLLNRALEMVAQAVGAMQGAILAVDPISDRLHFRARLGWPQDADDEDESLGLNEGLAGWAIQNRQSVIVDNVQNDPRWLRLSAVDDKPRAAMVALIESSEDILGVAMLYSDEPEAFNPDHLRLVTTAANQVANAMNNAELYSLIRDQAERLGSMLRQEQVEATKSGAILDSVADGVMVADSDGQVIVFNTAASRILDVPVDSVLDSSTSAIAGLYGSGQTQWAETVERWMQDPTAYSPGEYVEERITLEDERVLSVRLSPVHMGDQFLGTVSIFRDITREVEVDRLKSEFVATVSHELRTPMTSIKGYADLLLLGAAGEVSEQQQRFLETIKQNADRLSILVNDLLDISRIDQGRMELKFAPVEVEDLLDLVAVHLRGRSEDEKRPMNVSIEIPEDRHLTVWGDYDKVAQIMTNLADNAFSYTAEGGDITLAASEVPESGEVILKVIDSGIGIPPDVGDRIFERFFRGDESQDLVMDTPGTGLGLSIVRELVEVHGGTISYESEVGKGTTFFIRLPARARTPVSGD